MIELSATVVARNFSAVINRVGSGEEIRIVRNGVAIAELHPPAAANALTADRWREVMAAAPAVDDDFAADLDRARGTVGPPSGAWPS